MTERGARHGTAAGAAGAGTPGSVTTRGSRRWTLADRWPTGLALVVIAGATTVMALLDNEEGVFGPAIATMAGIYLMTYAIGRPGAAWLAFVVLSTVVSVFQVLHRLDLLGLDPGLAMTLVMLPLWLWAVARRRYGDAGTFTVQTVGMVAFGVVTLLCAGSQPQWGIALAGVGFLAHGAWDAYHFRADKVVSRPWSEFCAVVDLAVGVALLVVATT